MITRWYYPSSTDVDPAFIEWEDDIKVGDIVTAYFKGYHVVTDRKPDLKHPGYPDDIYITQLLDDEGNESPKRKRRCSAHYCSVMTPQSVVNDYEAAIQNAADKRDALLKLMNPS